MARGVIVHRLLQSLPDIPPMRRVTEAARRHLARSGEGLQRRGSRKPCSGRCGACSTMSASPSCSRPGSRAEVLDRRTPTAGRPSRRGLRPGGSPRRDRQRGADRRLQDQPACPAPIEDVPNAYVTQLALYRAVLGKLYPDKAIRAAADLDRSA